jgi:arsenate reductase
LEDRSSAINDRLDPMPPRPRVLFLCTGNSCRSQMAEGWARHLHGERLDASSAGLVAHGLNPHAVRVMAEAGVDISGHRSKTLAEVRPEALDVVVTVCGHADETCPALPGRVRRLHAPFDDPPRLAAAEPDPARALDLYRRVRDELRAFVTRLPETLETLLQEETP